MVVSCVVGLLVGFAVRPYIMPNTGTVQVSQYQVMDVLPDESGETNTDALLRHQKRSC